MGFRFRRSARLGPLRFHFTRNGLSSVSIGGPGASLNIPVARAGGPRTTLGLPGTGLSWSLEHRPDPPAAGALPAQPAGAAAGLPNSRRFRPGELEQFRRSCLDLLQQRLFREESETWQLWERGLVSRLLADPTVGARLRGQLACIETPQALEAYLLRGRSQDDVKRRADRCLTATREALRLSRARGWCQAGSAGC